MVRSRWFGLISGSWVVTLADTADRIDAAARATFEAVKGGAIRKQIDIATASFKKIAGRIFKKNQVHLESTNEFIDKLKAEETTGAEF